MKLRERERETQKERERERKKEKSLLQTAAKRIYSTFFQEIFLSTFSALAFARDFHSGRAQSGIV